MITKTRMDYVPIEQEQVNFTCLVPSCVDHPSPKSHTFNWNGYYRNYEMYTPNDYGGRNDWKSFEHFRSVQGDFSGSQLPFYTEKWASKPHIHRGFSSNIHFGYHIYKWGAELEPYGSPGSLNNGLPAWHIPDGNGHFVPEPADLDKLISHSLRMMMPGIKAELSLLNSIFELKDFKSLAMSLWKAKSKLFKLTTVLPDWIKKSRDGLWKTIKRSGDRKTASAFLQWKFAIEPLLSDVSSIRTALSRVERRINDLVTRAGRTQRRHFAFTWREYTDSYEKHRDPGFGYFPWEIASVGYYAPERYVYYEPTIFHAELEYRYYLSQYQTEHARLLGYLDAFGVNSNPAIIWNALPWSFVVDWVMGVSSWLDSMKTRNMEPQINILRYLWSVKRKRRIAVLKGISTSFYGLPPLGRTPMPVVTETAYRRQVGIPDWNSFYTSGISSNELVLGAALVIARRRRRNRR